MTLAYPGWPSDRARNGHGVRLLPRPLSRAGLIRTIGRAWGLSSLELDKIHWLADRCIKSGGAHGQGASVSCHGLRAP